MIVSHRFEIALAASFALNSAIWIGVSTAVQYKPAAPPTPLEFTRVIIDKKGRTVPKIVKRRPPPPPPKPKPELQPPPRRERPIPKPPPPSAHNRILTAPVVKGPAPKSDFTARSGGNAKLGAPTSFQGAGEGTTPTPKPPPQPNPVPAPAAAPIEPPKPAPPVEPPKAAPPPAPTPAPEPPKPKGPTQDAVPSHQVAVEIPDDLKTQSFKSFVRVRITIEPDGSFTVFLRSSSGNPQVDKLVTDALNKWKWKPAQRDGTPVESVQAFRFDFEVK